MKKRGLLVGMVGLGLVIILYLVLLRPIKIGVLISNETTLGYEENLLIRYFQSKYPRIGLRPLKFLIENPTDLEEETFQEAFTRLQGEGVHIILSGELSQTGLIVAPLAEETGIPTFGITTSSHSLSEKKDNFYRVVTPTNFLGRYMADYMDSLGYQRVAAITSVENAGYAGALADSFHDSFPGEFLQIPFNNLDSVVAQLDLYQPDALYCILPETLLMQVLQEVRETHEGMAIFSSDWGFMQLVSVFSGPQLDGITAISRSGEIPGEYRDFIDEYEEIYKLESTFASHNTTSILFMILDALREVGPNRAGLNRYFSEPRHYDTLIGPLLMDEYGDSHQQFIYFYQIMDGELELRQSVENPEYFRPLNE